MRRRQRLLRDGVGRVDEGFGASLYGAADRDQLPIQAVAASLGCGNPTAVADPHEGERVLDLGSGGGIDVLIEAIPLPANSIDVAISNLEAAGFGDIEITPTHAVADGMYSAYDSTCTRHPGTSTGAPGPQ